MAPTNGTGVKEETVKETRFRRRREARIEAHRQRSNNDAILTEFQPDAVEIEKRSVPGGARWTLYTVVALIAAFIFWANWAEVDKIVTAEGILVTTETDVVIDTKLTSPIKELNAKFGDRVHAGFVIATLDSTFSDADLAALQGQKKSLMASLARLTAERNGQPFTFDGHEEDRDWLVQVGLYNERKKQYLAEQVKFESQKSTLEVQMENLKIQREAQLEKYAKLRKFEIQTRDLAERGSKSSTDVLSREIQSSDARMEVKASDARMKELTKSLETVEAEKAAYVAGWRTQIVTDYAAANDSFNNLQQEINKATKSNEFVELKVPDDLPYNEFMVLEVSDKSVGSMTQPGEPLFRLVPVGVPMEVEVEIQGKDIALIETVTPEHLATGELPNGGDVRVKLASFPYQRHGTLDGIIRAISEGSFEKKLPGGGNSGVTTYKARVQLLDTKELENLPSNFRLMPGMTATTEIKVGKRKVMEYFLYPLLRYMDKAVREP
jgi:HlyD family secretion protein